MDMGAHEIPIDYPGYNDLGFRGPAEHRGQQHRASFGSYPPPPLPGSVPFTDYDCPPPQYYPGITQGRRGC
jgi:hypothetical protein